MIRVILNARTGNNLFQYAAGRALAFKHGVGLVLDGSWADKLHADQFSQLQRLPIAASYERRMTLAKRVLKKTFKLEPRYFYRGSYYQEASPHFDPSFAHLPDDAILNGYFQSQRYFSEIEPQLRSELDFQAIEIPGASRKFEDGLRSHTTVSIHVRRGDYLAISNTQCLPSGYHDGAIRHFRERLENLRFCVFSDDIPWCRQQFSGAEFLFCDLDGAHGDPLHDLRLMSACSHNIIVNSSYSWWGAWLNPSPEKIVVAPAQWMKGMPSDSVVPSTWMMI